MAVVHGVGTRPFPVKLSDVLGWSLTFRCLGTFGNYLTHLRGACCAMGFPSPPVGHPAVQRATAGIAKRAMFSPKPLHAVQRTMLRNLILHSEGLIGALWLTAYTWLLRLPSEALPLKIFHAEPPPGLHKSALWRCGECICLRLSCRKNLQSGSGVLKRVCSCRGSERTCPVHGLWDRHFASLPDGAEPWAGLTAASALLALRGVLQKLSVPCAHEFGTHAFRRGHARDLLQGGATLAEILRAGQWKSAAFLRYLESADIEQGAALEVACDTDEEEWID